MADLARYLRSNDRSLLSCGLRVAQAVLFVRDLDRGLLGRGSHGLQQYEMLRRGTDALVNGILRVRRLLKQKRTADAEGELARCIFIPSPAHGRVWQPSIVPSSDLLSYEASSMSPLFKRQGLLSLQVTCHVCMATT